MVGFANDRPLIGHLFQTNKFKFDVNRSAMVYADASFVILCVKENLLLRLVCIEFEGTRS